MARKIRFPLKMANGADVRSLEELVENFDLESALGYYEDGKLVTWLRDRYHDTEADKIEALDKTSKSFTNDFCAVFGIEAAVDDAESGADIDYISRRNEKKRILRTITDDESVIYNVDSVAMNQDDLLDIYDEGKKEIYLYQGEFEIPLSVTGVTYHGIADPIITVRVTDNVNFNEKNIKFVNCVYGWDVSKTTSADNMRRAENLFLKGDYHNAVSTFENYAKQGNPRAILWLYRFYQNHMPNKKKLDYWAEKSKQSFEAANIIANIDRKDKDGIKKCLPSLKKLANKGDSIDLYNYALALENEGTSPQEEIKYVMISAENGYALAQCKLGANYYNGNALEQNYLKAVEWFLKASDQGLATAQYNLGFCYYFGDGVTQDYPKAVEWYTKAAEQGHADAQNRLGNCYYNGRGVPQDYTKAVEWYTKAAEQDFDRAQNNLGNCYYNGKGVSQDYTKAVEWYTKAAEQGYDSAQNNLGNCYYNGEGCVRDYIKAVEWITKAAEQGLADAQNNLGYCYYNGEGVSQDYTKAVEWYTKAAEQGHIWAQNSLGECYCNGKGVTQNRAKAVEWFTRAAKEGNADAKKALEKLGVYNY